MAGRAVLYLTTHEVVLRQGIIFAGAIFLATTGEKIIKCYIDGDLCLGEGLLV
jgi:hypothetical protein